MDESDGRVNAQAADAASHPLTSTATAAAAADDAAAAGCSGHYVVSSTHRELSSLDNKTASWTSAEVMAWLERSRLQHLTEWYVGTRVYVACLHVNIDEICRRNVEEFHL